MWETQLEKAEIIITKLHFLSIVVDGVATALLKQEQGNASRHQLGHGIIFPFTLIFKETHPFKKVGEVVPDCFKHLADDDSAFC